MKKLFSLLTALTLLLCCAAPALAETAPVELRLPEGGFVHPEQVLLEDYLAWADELAAQYGAVNEWATSPFSDGLVSVDCVNRNGASLLATTDGRVVALNVAIPLDVNNPQEGYEAFLSTMIVGLQPLLRTQGMDCATATSAFIEACNTSEGFLVGIGDVVYTGAPLAFTYLGYEGDVTLLQVDGVTCIVLALYLDMDVLSETAALLADSTVEPVPAAGAAQRLSTQAYIDCYTAIAASYGVELQWQTIDYDDGMTLLICVTMENPGLLTLGDTLVSISAAIPYDTGDMQATFDGLVSTMLVTLETLYQAMGHTAEESDEMMYTFFNQEGFIASVIRVLTTGEEFNFTFEGYPCTLVLQEDGSGNVYVGLLVITDISLWYGY